MVFAGDSSPRKIVDERSAYNSTRTVGQLSRHNSRVAAAKNCGEFARCASQEEKSRPSLDAVAFAKAVGIVETALQHGAMERQYVPHTVGWPCL